MHSYVPTNEYMKRFRHHVSIFCCETPTWISYFCFVGLQFKRQPLPKISKWGKTMFNSGRWLYTPVRQYTFSETKKFRVTVRREELIQVLSAGSHQPSPFRDKTSKSKVVMILPHNLLWNAFIVFYCSWEHWFGFILVFQFNLKIMPTILIWSQPCETLYFSACVCGTSKAREGSIWSVSSTQMYLPLVSCVLCPVFCVLVFCVCGTSKAWEGSIFPGVENVSDNWETFRQHSTLNNPLHKSHIHHFCD